MSMNKFEYEKFQTERFEYDTFQYEKFEYVPSGLEIMLDTETNSGKITNLED